MTKQGLVHELHDLQSQVETLQAENKELLKRVPWVNEKLYKRRVEKLERKVQTLEKSDRDWRDRYKKYLDVHSYIMDCYHRMRKNKYSFDENRVREIIHVLERSLP